MADTIGALLSELDAFCKTAGAQESENITGQNPGSMPGSENDKPIPAGATSSDPKVKDPTIDRPATDSVAGAKPGSDFPASNVNEYQADETVLNPDKKPLDTADANAKTASSRGNSIVDFILKSKEKQAAAQKQAADQKQAAPQKEAAAQKQAAPAQETISLDMALMAKIAAITLADEEGQMAVQAALTKRAGAEFANEVLDTLEKRAAEEEAYAEFIKGAQDAEAMIGDLQEAQGAADAEQAMGDLQAAQGAADAEAALAGAGAAEAGDAMSIEDAAAELDNYSADEIVEAVQELAQEGQIPPDQAEAVIQAVTEAAQGEGDPGEVTEEDLAEAIVEAVESGELSEEDAQALVQAIAEEGGDPAADQALAADVAGAGAGADGAEKEAAVKRATFKRQLADVLKSRK